MLLADKVPEERFQDMSQQMDAYSLRIHPVESTQVMSNLQREKRENVMALELNLINQVPSKRIFVDENFSRRNDISTHILGLGRITS